MADLIEKIGPYLGIVAFGALAVLAFLIFQQAREVRRLRDWAGRAPERATEAAEATAAAVEARGAAAEAEPTDADADARAVASDPGGSAVAPASPRSSRRSTAALRSTLAGSSPQSPRWRSRQEC